MNTPVRLVAFAAGLALAFAAAVGVGNAVGPVGPAGGEGGHDDVHGGQTRGETSAGAHGGHDAGGASAAPVKGAEGVPGLAVSAEGYTLRLTSAEHPLGFPAPFSFTVLGPSGSPVTTYTPTHDKDLHLIVVRRDTTGFQHLHPEQDGRGGWTTPLLLDRAGTYKVFADFAPDGRTDAVTLAADVSVSGAYEPQPLPAVSRTAAVDDYVVTLTGDLVAGRESALTLSVTRGGRPVADLEPYLAAYGHLVALRVGDLGYLHVHPEGEPGDSRTPAGPDIPFLVDVPTPGDYRLYLNFQHEGQVRTAEFRAVAEEGS